MILGIAAAAAASAGAMVWSTRGRSSSVFGPSVWRGTRTRRSIALTFDDGPSESTPEVLKVLAEHDLHATFFQCGCHVRRLPEIARAVAAAGHELGNHTDTHTRLYLRPRAVVHREVRRAQETIREVTGHSPKLFRAPYGVRWFGLAEAQKKHQLLGVMWTVIGRDWELRPPEISRRIVEGALNGAIICLHDGRERTPKPDIRSTIDALRIAIPVLLERGYRFETVSQILRETSK